MRVIDEVRYVEIIMGIEIGCFTLIGSSSREDMTVVLQTDLGLKELPKAGYSQAVDVEVAHDVQGHDSPRYLVVQYMEGARWSFYYKGCCDVVCCEWEEGNCEDSCSGDNW